MTPAEQLMRALSPVKDAGSRKGTPSQKSKLWLWMDANHLICESDLISLSSAYFMSMFIVSLAPPSLSPVTPGADVDTREKIWPKYFDLKHCSCKQLGEASPD